MKRTAAALILCLAAGSLPAAAEDAPAAFSCDFRQGTSWSYDAGTYKSKDPSPLTFDIEKIDLEGQSAVLKASPEAAPATLRIVRAINANHFLEAVNEGFLNLTTIYDKDPATGAYPAVHSRHFGLIGQPVFAQYAGTCTPK